MLIDIATASLPFEVGQSKAAEELNRRIGNVGKSFKSTRGK